MLTNGKLPYPASLGKEILHFSSVRALCAFVRAGGIESYWVRKFSICENFSSVTVTLEKFSQMENFLTQYDSMPPAFTNAHTQEKSSQMEKFLTQHDSMVPAVTDAHVHL